MKIHPRLAKGLVIESNMTTKMSGASQGSMPMMQGMKSRMKQTVKKISTKAFDTSMFKVPAGYKKLKPPKMN